MSKFFTHLTLIFISLMMWQGGYASHFMGADLTYACLNPCTYRITVSVYYDCEGAAVSFLMPLNPNANPGLTPFVNFTCGPNGAGVNPTVVTPWTLVTWQEVTPVCPGSTTGCTQTGGGALFNGVAQATYYQDYNLCNLGCNQVCVTWSNCCRNYAVTSGAGGAGIYLQSVCIDLTAAAACNSSPVFNSAPIPYICAGQPFVFNQGATDPNGDSLSYAIGPCLSGNNTPVTYSPGFSSTAPLGPTWVFSINPVTGDITVTPNPGVIQIGVLCVYITEWRKINGVYTQIGQIERDMQFTVINCPVNNTAPIGTTAANPGNPLSNLVGVTQVGNTLELNACINNPFDFDFSIFDPNATSIPNGNILNNQVDTMKITGNPSLAGVTFTPVPGTPPTPVGTWVQATQLSPYVIYGSSVLTGHFNITLTTAGTYFITVTVKDNSCPLPGINQYTLVIHANCCTLNPTVQTSIHDCSQVDFVGIPGCGVPPFTYAWSGITPNPGNVATFTNDFLAPGNYLYSLTVTDVLGNGGTYNGNVVIANNSIADAGPDLTLCPMQPGIIGTPALPGYTYSWVSNPPLTGFNSLPGAAAQEQVILNNGTTQPIPIQYCLTAIDPLGCPATDCMNVAFNGKPLANFGVTPEACEGSCVTVQYVGVPPVGALYNWVFPGGTCQGNCTGPGPFQVCYATAGNYTISLQVSVNGCISNITNQTVVIHPIPTSTFTATTPICANQSSTVTYTGNATANASYTWNFDSGLAPGAGQGPYQVSWQLPGTYNISLSVEEYGCSGTQTINQVVVNQLPSAQFAAPDSVCINDPNIVTYIGNASSTATYNWSFGNGLVASGQGPHTTSWSVPGNPQVCLQVQENGCTSNLVCVPVTVLPKPIAGLSVVPNPNVNQCLNGNAFQFVYTGTTPIDAIYWGFPNSVEQSSALLTPPLIHYLTAGTKTAYCYVVKDGCASDTAFVTFDVIAEPDAMFAFATGQTCQNDTIDFEVTATNPVPTSYSWVFSNGLPATSTLSSLPVIFPGGGSQSATLIADHYGCRDTLTQSVFINVGPQVSAGADKDICDGAGPIILDGTVTGGNAANYYYNWWSNPASGGGISNPNVEDPTVNPTTCVKYYFQATDAIGCRSNIDSVDVCVKPRPKASAGGDRYVCDAAGAFCTFLNGSVANAAQVPGPYTYSWFPTTGMPPGGDTIPNPCVHPTQSLVYTLVVFAANGCSSVITTLDTASTVTVDVRNVPTVEAGPDKEICKGTTIQLNGFASGTGPLYAYSWTPNDPAAAVSNSTIPSPVVGPAFTTQYTLTATSNGCSASDTVNVVVHTLPTAAIQPPVSDICQGESITLIGNADGDPTGLLYIYSWTNGATLSDTTTATTIATPTTTTTYQLYAGTTECIGFVDAITVTVKPTPITDIPMRDTLICYGQTIDLKANYTFNGTTPATPIVYSWTPLEGLSANNIANPTAQPTHTTTYVATISVGGSCPTKDSVRIDVTPSLNVVAAADTTVICGNNGTNLHASGGNGNPKYTWSPAYAVSNIHTQNTQFVDTTAGVTVVTLTIEEGGCVETDNISLTVHPGPTSDYYASHKQGCVPMEVNFLEKTTNTTNFIWHFGDGQISNNPNPTHIYTKPGTYLVDLVALGAGGCSDVAALTTITVSDTTFGGFISTPPIDSLIYVPNAKVVFTDTTHNSIAWVWNFGDGKTSSEKNPTHLYQMPNDYSVSLTVTNEHGCVSHITHTPYRVVSPELMIPNVFTPNGDGLHDKWEVMYLGNSDIEIKTYDRWGKLLFTSNSVDSQWDGKNKQGAIMSDGVYFYEVKVDDKVYTGNVTILR